MRTTSELIAHKRDGNALSSAEIAAFLEGAVDGSVPEYQISAMLMAIYFSGMADDELAAFTLAMIESGDRLQITTDRKLVDKHSTGGVGDKISIPLAPLVASCGAAIPMMSGRGLGHTGGTLDKLESIPGFSPDFTPSEFSSIVERTGCIIAGQSDRIVPADRLLYRLRDTTATVASVPLIASSIMSKKMAEGLDALVLDIKVGLGAFMKTDDEARQLARTMIRIGSAHGVEVRVFLTSMDQPLGFEVGNANEIRESIAVLKGDGPADVTTLVHTFGIAMLQAAGIGDAARCVTEAIASGRALERFGDMVEAQGGDPAAVYDPTLLPTSAHTGAVHARDSGIVTGLDAYAVGMAGVDLGAGRETAEDMIDHGAGITLAAKIGTEVEAGQALATVGSADPGTLAAALERLEGAYTIADDPPELSDLVREEITA